MFQFGLKFSVGALTVEWGEDGFRSVEWRGVRRWQLWSMGKGWKLDNASTLALGAARGW